MRVETKWDAAARRIAAECMPQLLALEAELRANGHRIVGAVLPAHLDPGKYDGEGATDMPAQFMGLPVTWGAEVGLIVAADSHLARIGNSLRDLSPIPAPAQESPDQ